MWLFSQWKISHTYSRLYKAARSSNAKKIKELLAKSAYWHLNLDRPDEYGKTAIFMAYESSLQLGRDHNNVFLLLLVAGANPTVVEVKERYTILHACLLGRDMHWLNFLLWSSPDIERVLKLEWVKEKIYKWDEDRPSKRVLIRIKSTLADIKVYSERIKQADISSDSETYWDAAQKYYQAARTFEPYIQAITEDKVQQEKFPEECAVHVKYYEAKKYHCYVKTITCLKKIMELSAEQNKLLYEAEMQLLELTRHLSNEDFLMRDTSALQIIRPLRIDRAEKAALVAENKSRWETVFNFHSKRNISPEKDLLLEEPKELWQRSQPN